MIKIDELKKEIEATGYYPTEELLYDTFNALMVFMSGESNPGQDVFALCLEGPPGAGKSSFAKMYRDIVEKHFNTSVELVEYQCDPATSEEKLKEDIRIVSVVTRNGKDVIIPGILVRTVQLLNEGKKVILFVDEYDKAREETDSFFLQFLQDGKLNAVQSGDMEVKKEYKNNLQVIFCKNDAREELSGPLTRRLRVIRLDYMKPELFHTVARRVLIDEASEKIEESLLNLVTLMYQYAYSKKEIFNRLPSCSEMLIALEDANRLMNLANAPQYIIYRTLVKNMFKNQDDLTTFEEQLPKSRDEIDKKLAKTIKEMKQNDIKQDPKEEKQSLVSLMSQTVFEGEAKKLAKTAQGLEDLIKKYELEFAAMKKRYEEEQEQELERIRLENGQLLSSSRFPKAEGNFFDETLSVRRGKSIFEIDINDEWTEVARASMPSLSHPSLIENLIEAGVDVTIYENGIALENDDNYRLIVFKELDEEKNPHYRFMANHSVIPSTFLGSIYAFIDFSKQVFDGQLNRSSIKESGNYQVNALVYDDQELTYEKVLDHVYHVEINDKVDHIDKLGTMVESLSCADFEPVTKSNNQLIERKEKVLTK